MLESMVSRGSEAEHDQDWMATGLVQYKILYGCEVAPWATMVDANTFSQVASSSIDAGPVLRDIVYVSYRAAGLLHAAPDECGTSLM